MQRNCPRHLILSLHTLHALHNEHGCLFNAVPLQQAAQFHKVLLEAKAVRLFFLGFDLVFFFLQPALSEVPLPQVTVAYVQQAIIPQLTNLYNLIIS